MLNKKASINITQILSVVMAVIIAAAIYTIFSGESAFNKEVIKKMDNAMMKNAYANLIVTDSCLIAKDSLGNPRHYRLDIDFVKTLEEGKEIPCIDFPNFEYVMHIYINKSDMSGVEEDYVFRNIENVEEAEKPVQYYIVTTDGRAGVIAFTYLNITE